MLKTAMLVSALALSAPVLAQDQTTPGRQPMTTAPAAPQAAPAQDSATTPADQTATTAPQANPAAPAQTAQAPTAPAQTAAAPTETATPVTGATQIAQVVNTEFPTYDKNADTNLDKTEFAAWMVALKTASDPTTKATDPATAKWIEGAFASADVDKSKLVSKTELTSYLSQGAE